MNGRVLPVDRLLAIYNLIVAGVWAMLPGRVPYAPWLILAHLAGAALPALLARVPGRPTAATRVVRDFYPWLFLLTFWGELDLFRTVLHSGANDHTIAPLDLRLFGTHLHATWMPAMPAVWLSEVMHALYFLYYALILLPPLYMAAARRADAFRDMTFRLLVTYLGCYLIYTAFPVDGPHFLMEAYDGQLRDGFVYRLVRSLQEMGDSRGCAFPSSHVAGAVTIAFLGWRWFRPVVALLLSAEALGVVVSTVYTQNHYAIDSVAGVIFALALQAALVTRLERALTPRAAARPPFPVLPAPARSEPARVES